MLKAGLIEIIHDARHVAVHPLGNCAVGVVVERVHAHIAESGFLGVGVPALPDGGCALVNRIEPRRIAALEEELVGDVGRADVGQRLHDGRCAEEAGLKLVAVAFDVVKQSLFDNFLGLFAREQVHLERHQVAGLLSALEGAVRVDKGVLEEFLFGLIELLVTLSVLCFAEDSRHLGHHLGIPRIVRGADEVFDAVVVGLIREPVAIAVSAALGALGSHENIHKFLHGLVVLFDDRFVAVHLVDVVRDDDAGVRPAELTCAAERSAGRGVRICAVVRLGVPHILHKFSEEALGIRIVCRCGGENLGVRRPALALVALRAVGRDAEVVAVLSPQDVADELVDVLVGGRQGTGVFCHRGDHDAAQAVNGDRCGGGNLRVAETVEGVGGVIGLHSLTAQDVGASRSRRAEVRGVDAALWAVVAAGFEAVVVVEHLAVAHCDNSALGAFHRDLVPARKVLTKVDDRLLAGCKGKGFIGAVGAGDVDVAVLIRGFVDRAVVNRRGFDAEFQVFPHPDGRADLGDDFSLKLGVLIREVPLGVVIAVEAVGGICAAVVDLALVDVARDNGALQSGFPGGVGADGLARTVGVLEHEFCAIRAVGAITARDRAAPPAGGHGCSQGVRPICKQVGHVVGIVEYPVCGLGVPRFELVVNHRAVGLAGADPFAVDKRIKDAEAGDIVFRGNNFSRRGELLAERRGAERGKQDAHAADDKRAVFHFSGEEGVFVVKGVVVDNDSFAVIGVVGHFEVVDCAVLLSIRTETEIAVAGDRDAGSALVAGLAHWEGIDQSVVEVGEDLIPFDVHFHVNRSGLELLRGDDIGDIDKMGLVVGSVVAVLPDVGLKDYLTGGILGVELPHVEIAAVDRIEEDADRSGGAGHIRFDNIVVVGDFRACAYFESGDVARSGCEQAAIFDAAGGERVVRLKIVLLYNLSVGRRRVISDDHVVEVSVLPGARAEADKGINARGLHPVERVYRKLLHEFSVEIGGDRIVGHANLYMLGVFCRAVCKAGDVNVFDIGKIAVFLGVGAVVELTLTLAELPHQIVAAVLGLKDRSDRAVCNLEIKVQGVVDLSLGGRGLSRITDFDPLRAIPSIVAEQAGFKGGNLRTHLLIVFVPYGDFPVIGGHRIQLRAIVLDADRLLRLDLARVPSDVCELGIFCNHNRISSLFLANCIRLHLPTEGGRDDVNADRVHHVVCLEVCNDHITDFLRKCVGRGQHHRHDKRKGKEQCEHSPSFFHVVPSLLFYHSSRIFMVLSAPLLSHRTSN